MLQHNPNILTLMQSGPFCVDFTYAVEVFSTYIEELQLLESGAAYAELGISQRRAQSMPGIIAMYDNKPKRISDSMMLSDSSQTPEGSFAHLRLQGFMRTQDGASSRGINSLVEDINAANENENIAGILLEVNTGGGQASAGDILNTAIRGSQKPVIVLGHMVASAGYMAAMGATEIIASSSAAQIGSIGTMMTLPKGFANWYNTYYQDIYASKSTNKNRAFRAFLEGDLSGMKESLEIVNEHFLAAVRDQRELKGKEGYQAHTLSGELFTAQEARRRGLIDGIGGMNYAIKRLQAAATRR
jgi:ClpP class serine protease